MKNLFRKLMAITGAITVIASPCSMKAQSGSWNVDADGNWSDSAKWLDGIIANGAGNTADFSATPITMTRTVTLDTSRTIGTINIGELNLSYYNQNFVSGGGSVLTMDNGPMMPLLISSGYRQFYIPLAGANGLNLANAVSDTFGSVLGIYGSNSYSGVTVIGTNIQVYARSTNTFGSFAAGTTVNVGGSIFLDSATYPAAEPLNLSGNGFAGDGHGALRSGGGATRTWSGDIISSQSAQGTIGVDDGGTLILTGSLTGGNSQFTEKTGGGTLILAGNVPALSPYVSQGTLQIGNGGTTGNLVDSAYYGNFGTIAFNRSDTYTWAPTTYVGGNGTILAMGPGKLVINSYEPFHGNDTSSDPPQQGLSIGPGAVVETANFVPINLLTLNGGTLSAVGGHDSTRQSWALWNGVNVPGNSLTSVIMSSGANSDIQLLDAPHATVFNVAIGAANGIDLSVPAVLTHSYWDYGNFGTLIKTGIGTMVLSGANLYQNGTTVSAGTLLVNNTSGSGTGSGGVNVQSGGTLGGNGTISGTVTVQPGGILSPGASIGKLTVGGLTLGGTTKMELNKSNSPLTNDLVASTGTLNYGGTLVVTNVGPALSVGDNFVLFSPAGSGNFADVVLPVLHGGLGWVNHLASSGSISVVQAFNPNPTNITMQVSGGYLTLSWPADHTGWVLQSQTNTLTGANWVNVTGSESTDQWVMPIDPSNRSVFFRLILP